MSSDTSKEPLKERLIPAPSLGASNPELVNESHNSASMFKFDDNTTTPIQRSTNALKSDVSTAPPFLKSSEGSITAVPPGLVDINLAIGALDLDFGSTARSKEKQNTTNEPTAADPASENEKINSNILKKDSEQPSHLADGIAHHHQQQQHQRHQQQHFPPFFPINGFGQPLPNGFNPVEHLDGTKIAHHQLWPTKPGQVPFGTHLNKGLDPLNHNLPIHHPGIIPFRPFDFGPDGIINHPEHLNGHHSPALSNFGEFNDGSVNDSRVDYHHPGTPIPGFPNGVDFGNRSGNLQNPQLWNSINGRPQDFNDGFGLNGHSHNGPRSSNNHQYYSNNGNNHHHHHQQHGHRKYGGHRKRGEDASRFANAKLEDFVGQIYSLCKDQHGCRFLQKQLDENEGNATIIFDEVNQYIVELMLDSFGNYLVQKLLIKVNDEQRLTLIKNTSPELVKIALDPHGTRALQKLIECLSSNEQAQIIIAALSNHVVTLSRDLNGNHVIQKCLEVFTNEDSQFIFDAAISKTFKIATHRHGCCVLQRCLDHGSEKQREELSSVVSKIADELSYDAFGNYVVQYVLVHGDKKFHIEIINALKDDCINLSLHKFGSNVIEKCFRTTPKSQILIGSFLEKENGLAKLLNDLYGNYVLQTILDVAGPEDLEKLSNILKPLLPEVRNTPHGRRIAARFQEE